MTVRFLFGGKKTLPISRPHLFDWRVLFVRVQPQPARQPARANLLFSFLFSGLDGKNGFLRESLLDGKSPVVRAYKKYTHETPFPPPPGKLFRPEPAQTQKLT